jgi:hypothetical protein
MRAPSDAGRNYQSGPIATAVQWVSFLPLFCVLLPLGLLVNLWAWLSALASGGVAKLVAHKTLPTHNLYRKVSSRTRVLNVTELEEKTLDPDKCRTVFASYAEINGFRSTEAAIEFRTMADDCDKSSVYHEMVPEQYEGKVRLVVYHGARRSIICGLFDFGYFDGTSCFNFVKGFLSAYFDGHAVLNRPAPDNDIELRFADRFAAKLGARYAFGVAAREAVTFARGWARWGLSREALDPILAPEISSVLITIDETDTAAMLDALRSESPPIKPFAHLLASTAAAVGTVEDRSPVCLLTQISCQQRYYEPPLPRDQVGYWLIGRSSWHSLSTLADLSFCRDYYRTLTQELETLEGKTRQALVRQAMLGLGGSGNIINTRQLFWFNNYGARQMTPRAGRVTYHWAPNFRMCTHVLANIITVNDHTCITLSSNTIGLAKLADVAQEMKQRLLAGGRAQKAA